jgi:hypothetical protein
VNGIDSSWLHLDFEDAAVEELPPHVARFREFHNENPHVYDHLVLLAREGARHSDKLGIGQLFEVLRWQRMLTTTDPDFKLNNNYRAHYPRLIMEREPDLAGIFDTRMSMADEA